MFFCSDLLLPNAVYGFGQTPTQRGRRGAVVRKAGAPRALETTRGAVPWGGPPLPALLAVIRATDEISIDR